MEAVGVVDAAVTRWSQKPIFRVLTLIGVLFLSEMIILGILDLQFGNSSLMRNLTDILLQLVFVIPLLYFGVLRPMDQYLSDLRKVQQSLGEREAHFRSLTNSGEAIIWMVGPDKQCNFVNQTFLDFTGRKQEEKMGEVWTLDIHPIDRLICASTFQKAFDNRERFSMKYRLLHHGSSYRWIHSNGSPTYDQNGIFTGYVGHCLDIHEHKLAEDNIIKRENDYRTLFEFSPMPAIFWDMEGTILFWNQAAEKTFGHSKEEVTGRNMTYYFKPDIRNPEKNYDIAAVVSNLDAKPVVREFLRNDGRIIFCEWYRTPIYGLDGKIRKIISVAKDITEQKEFEQKLIAAKEKAEESEKLKSAFLANMSHELRSPLNSIIGFSELLSDPDNDTDQQQKFAQLINLGGKNLLQTITDLMDYSIIDAGQVKIQKQQISINALLRELHMEYCFKASAKGIDLLLDIDPCCEELTMESDEVKLRQVLVNLISNALKFTSHGNIEIGIRTTDSLAQFHVKDTGIGIPQEFKDKIFERFLQVEPHNKRKYGGIGLGLAISKSLVELLGGNIWVESLEGSGSTFYFNLPLSKTSIT